VFNQLVRDRTDTLKKEDESPVTGINLRLSGLRVKANQSYKVGDYAAQAVINTVLRNAFPKDPIVGEEGADALRQESNARLRERVVSLATNALQEDLIDGEKAQWGLGSQHEHSSEALLKAIDEGNDMGGPNKRKAMLDGVNSVF
jgi:3'(2'), 5'-bisphosphate nucleotidase